MGLSPQKSLYRAYQADPEAVEQWKSATFPKIQKQAKKAKATIYFTDEVSVHCDCHADTTWAPVGRTPVVQAGPGSR